MKRLAFFLVLLLVVVSAFAVTNTVFSDVDGDGDTDIFLTRLVIDNGTNYIFNTTVEVSNISGVTQGYFVDFAGTPFEDLYIVRAGSQNQVYQRIGSTFVNVTSGVLGQKLSGTNPSIPGTVFADFDADGDIDVYVNQRFYISNGSFASLNGTSTSNLDELPPLRHAMAVDINNDGLNDIFGIVFNPPLNNNSVVLFMNLGDNNDDDVPEFYDVTRDAELNLTRVNHAGFGDLDFGLATNMTITTFPFAGILPPFMLDNFTDIVVGKNISQSQILTQLFPEPFEKLLTVNHSTFYIPRFMATTFASNSTWIIVADFDSNNVSDIFHAGPPGVASAIRLRNGSSWSTSFITASGNFSNMSNIRMAQALDINGDGSLDIAGINDSFLFLSSIAVGNSAFQVSPAPSLGGGEAIEGTAAFGEFFGNLMLASQAGNVVFQTLELFIDSFSVTTLADTGHLIIGSGALDGSFAFLFSSSACGNGFVEGSEGCDDSNVINGDGCSSVCTVEATCGDSVINVGEDCDPVGSVAVACGGTACAAGCVCAVTSTAVAFVGGGGGGGSGYLNQRVDVKFFAVSTSSGLNKPMMHYPSFDLRYGDDIDVFAHGPFDITIRGQVVYTDGTPAAKAQAVTINIGGQSEFVQTNSRGYFATTIENLDARLRSNDFGSNLVISFTPRLINDAGSTYGIPFQPSPTINFNVPGIVQIPGEIPSVMFNGIGIVPVPVIPSSDVPTIKLPHAPGVAVGCDLACKNTGNAALFFYTPPAPTCPPDFTAECAYAYSGVGASEEMKDFVNAHMDECCALGTSAVPPPETSPTPEFPIPPAEESKCKLVCDYSAPSALFKYVPTGSLDCKPDFRVRCDHTVADMSGGKPIYIPKPGDPHASEADGINSMLGECCEGKHPEYPGITADPKNCKKVCDTPGVEGGAKAKYVRVQGGTEACQPTPEFEDCNDTDGQLGGADCCDPKRPPINNCKEVCTAPGMVAGPWNGMIQATWSKVPGGDLPCLPNPEFRDCPKTGVCCNAAAFKCPAEHHIFCRNGGGAFIQQYSPGGGDPPCPNPPLEDTIFPCGGAGPEFAPPPFPGVSPSWTLQSFVGKKNYDECCGTGDAGTAYFATAEDCKTDVQSSECMYNAFIGSTPPFARYVTITKTGCGADDGVQTYTTPCSCDEMTEPYGGCGAELSFAALTDQTAYQIQQSCCPAASTVGIIPGPTPITPEVTPETGRQRIPITGITPGPTPGITPGKIGITPTPTPTPTIPPPPACIADGKGTPVEVISVPGEFPAGAVPDGMKLIDVVKTSGCSGREVSFTRDISNAWRDVQVMVCEGGTCSLRTVLPPSESSCSPTSVEGALEAEVTGVVQKMTVSEMEAIVQVGQEMSSDNRAIVSGNYRIIFTGALPEGLVGIRRPTQDITLPANYCVAPSGTPLVLDLFDTKPLPVQVTLPVKVLEGAAPSSYAIYVAHGADWIEIENSKYDEAAGTITSTLPDVSQYASNNQVLFMAAGLTCRPTESSCSALFDGGYPETNVLIHGFTATRDTWKPLVSRAIANGEEYNWVSFEYPDDATSDEASKEFTKCLNSLPLRTVPDKVNIVAHSVGAKIAQKSLKSMIDEGDPDAYRVAKFVSLGSPNNGIDRWEARFLAEVLANHNGLATMLDRRSVIVNELLEEQHTIELNAPWIQSIGVAGTRCDVSDYVDFVQRSFVGDPATSGRAFEIAEKLQRLSELHDCVLSESNALAHIENPTPCSNVFKPRVWHALLNNPEMSELIMYTLNKEKIDADPLLGLTGVSQMVTWSDTCDDAKVYGIVGSQGSLQLPAFCNCGNGVCERDVGEDEGTCPTDCDPRAAFICQLLKNLAALMLIIMSITLAVYLGRKHIMKKEVNDKRWRTIIGAMGIATAALLIASLFYCPMVPWLLILLTALVTGGYVGEMIVSKETSPRESPKTPKMATGGEVDEIERGLKLSRDVKKMLKGKQWH